MRARPGRRGARDDEDDERQPEPASELAEIRIAHVFARAGSVEVLRVVIEQRADRHHREADHEVQRDEIGIELRVDDEGAEDRRRRRRRATRAPERMRRSLRRSSRNQAARSVARR